LLQENHADHTEVRSLRQANHQRNIEIQILESKTHVFQSLRDHLKVVLEEVVPFDRVHQVVALRPCWMEL
jgi:hypothetical protein